MAQNWEPWLSEVEIFDFRSAGSENAVPIASYTFTSHLPTIMSNTIAL